MIVVDCLSRLGNQMFQYAFGLEAARRLRTDFVMEDDQLRALFVLGPRGRAAEALDYPTVKIDNEDYGEPEDVLARLEDRMRYHGFFQSERFFPDVAGEVRAAFRLRPEHEHAFRARYADLLERGYVCCHIRRTDYLTFAGGVALPMSYYHTSLARLAPPSGTPIVFVGDDLDEARKAFGSVDGVRFEQNDEAVDIQLLMHAHAVVVSNSTFAWWGAWLNARPEKRVLAPRHWLGFTHRTGWHNKARSSADRRTRRGWEYPRGVIPDGWIQIRVKRPWRERISPSALRSSLALLTNNALALLEEV